MAAKDWDQMKDKAQQMTLTIRELRDKVGIDPILTDEEIEYIWMAIDKQEPMNPIRKGKNLYCPICEKWLLWDDAIPNEGDNHCGICGQKLDWEDEE